MQVFDKPSEGITLI